MKFEIIPDQQTPKLLEIEDVQAFIADNKDSLQAFLAYASTKNNAVGLAGNQCSCDGERFMLRVFGKRESFGKWRLIINPVITEYIGIKELKVEGCLTWVGQAIIAERSRAIKVTYYNEEGLQIVDEFYKGFDAEVFQHEINHLNGVEEEVTRSNEYVNSIKDIEVGRNEPCPCGSGKKYKQCCLLLK